MTSTIPRLSAHHISVPARSRSPGLCSVATGRFETPPSVLSLTPRLLSHACSCPELLHHCRYEKKKKEENCSVDNTHKATLAHRSYRIVSLCVLVSWLTNRRALRSSGAAGSVCSTIRTGDVSVAEATVTQRYLVASHVSSKLPTVAQFITRFCFRPGASGDSSFSTYT